MSVKYIDKNGNIINASGLTPGGNLEAGTIAQRTGTKQITVSANSSIGVQITFSDPMPDADYDVNIEIVDAPLSGLIGGLLIMPVNTGSKTANGFEIAAYNNTSSSLTVTVSYTAFKTYTVQHAAETAASVATLEAVVPAGAGPNNKLTTQTYVDNADNALDERLDDVEDVIPTGTTITNQLVNKSELQTAIDNVEIDVDDEIDATSENPVQNKVIKAALDAKENKQFTGTQAEWNALTEAQKKSYRIANIINDTDYVGNIVDTVADGNMSAVTSNAVFDKFASISAIGDHTYDDTELVQIGSDTRVLARRYGDLVQISADGATFTRNNSYLVYDATIPSKYMPTTSSVPAIGVAIVGGNPYITWISHDGTFIVGGQSALESTTTVYTTLVYFIK